MVLAGVGLIVCLTLVVSKLHLVDQAKGALGVSASCDAVKLANLKRDFTDKGGGSGLAFKPYAEALEKCASLNGQSREFVRSTFGPHFDSDRRSDSWLIGTGLFERRSMWVTYSADGLVTRVTLVNSTAS